MNSAKSLLLILICKTFSNSRLKQTVVDEYYQNAPQAGFHTSRVPYKTFTDDLDNSNPQQQTYGPFNRMPRTEAKDPIYATMGNGSGNNNIFRSSFKGGNRNTNPLNPEYELIGQKEWSVSQRNARY